MNDGSEVGTTGLVAVLAGAAGAAGAILARLWYVASKTSLHDRQEIHRAWADLTAQLRRRVVDLSAQVQDLIRQNTEQAKEIAENRSRLWELESRIMRICPDQPGEAGNIPQAGHYPTTPPGTGPAPGSPPSSTGGTAK